MPGEPSEITRVIIAILPSIVAGVAAWIGSTFFSVRSQKKISLYNEKLTRYSTALKAIGVLISYLDDFYDEGSQTFTEALPERLDEKRSALRSIMAILRERDFVISVPSALNIQTFVRECPLFWPDYHEGSAHSFFKESRAACDSAAKNLILTAKIDVDWEKEDHQMLDT